MGVRRYFVDVGADRQALYREVGDRARDATLFEVAQVGWPKHRSTHRDFVTRSKAGAQGGRRVVERWNPALAAMTMMELPQYRSPPHV